MKLPCLFLIAVCAWSVRAETLHDDLRRGALDETLWLSGTGGTVRADGEGIYLSGGEGENAASIALKHKVGQDEFYDLKADIKPLSAESQGYAVLAAGPGWMVAGRPDGAFWMQCGATVVGTSEPLPMDRWYGLTVKNRRGMVRAEIAGEDGEILVSWTAPKAPGLDGRINFAALVGANRPGPRGMYVREVSLTPLEEGDYACCPEDDMAWLDAAFWEVSGEGKVFNDAEGNLRAEIASGSLVLKLPETPAFAEVVEAACSLRISSGDESYNLIYTLNGDGEAMYTLSDLNRSGSSGFSEIILNPELADTFGGTPSGPVRQFRVNPSFLEGPWEVTVERFQMLLK